MASRAMVWGNLHVRQITGLRRMKTAENNHAKIALLRRNQKSRYRAVAAGCINHHSIDELKSCGRFVRKTSISTALMRAMDEIQQRELSGLDSLQELKAARKRTRFSKANHDKAATEMQNS